MNKSIFSLALGALLFGFNAQASEQSVHDHVSGVASAQDIETTKLSSKISKLAFWFGGAESNSYWWVTSKDNAPSSSQLTIQELRDRLKAFCAQEHPNLTKLTIGSSIDLDEIDQEAREEIIQNICGSIKHAETAKEIRINQLSESAEWADKVLDTIIDGNFSNLKKLIILTNELFPEQIEAFVGKLIEARKDESNFGQLTELNTTVYLGHELVGELEKYGIKYGICGGISAG